MSTSPEYTIRHVYDFLSVPADRRADCLREFAACLGLVDASLHLLDGIQVDPPEAFIWIDDGLHIAKLVVTDGIETVEIASGKMRGFD